MATNQRRRERYGEDESYRERRLRYQREKRAAEKAERERHLRLRGWEPIGTAPDGEYILLWDPDIFWPFVAKLDEDGLWRCIHYDGPQPRPTHWRWPLELPLP